MHTKSKIAVVIPCYRVRRHILSVLSGIGPEVSSVYVVDDACPENSGVLVKNQCHDPRVAVITHERNGGVGAATMTGYRAALEEGADIIVKLDGDGQMDASLISRLIEPISSGQADYVKGNRFFDIQFLEAMPLIRKIGNSALSFISKLSSGYWNIMDPTNGFTAIHATALRMLPLEKIEKRYFFESDMLFRLNTIRAVVWDLPMTARYGNEKSGMNLSKILFEFSRKHAYRLFKRIFYNYFLRDFNAGSVELIVGVFLCLLGFSFGIFHWYESSHFGIPATTGTVMLATLPIIVGTQLLISALSFDTINIPTKPLQLLMASPTRSEQTQASRAAPY